jgi:hypothetical protein
MLVEVASVYLGLDGRIPFCGQFELFGIARAQALWRPALWTLSWLVPFSAGRANSEGAALKSFLTLSSST